MNIENLDNRKLIFSYEQIPKDNLNLIRDVAELHPVLFLFACEFLNHPDAFVENFIDHVYNTEIVLIRKYPYIYDHLLELQDELYSFHDHFGYFIYQFLNTTPIKLNVLSNSNPLIVEIML